MTERILDINGIVQRISEIESWAESMKEKGFKIMSAPGPFKKIFGAYKEEIIYGCGHPDHEMIGPEGNKFEHILKASLKVSFNYIFPDGSELIREQNRIYLPRIPGNRDTTLGYCWIHEAGSIFYPDIINSNQHN